MATNTTNLNLAKPATSDAVDITVINSNMDKLDAVVGDKALGSFSDAAGLNALLNAELATMANHTWRSIRVTASASFDSFVNAYVYYGTLFRGGSTNYARVMLYPNASPHVITGEVATNGTWVYRRLATVNEVDEVSDAVGPILVKTVTIPSKGTATIRTSSTMPCLIFTSYGATAASFSAHYASISASGAPQFMPFFTPGSSVSLAAASGGGVIVSNNLSTTLSLIVIRVMGEATATITTASA